MNKDDSRNGLQDLTDAMELIRITVSSLTKFRDRSGHFTNPRDKYRASDVVGELLLARQRLLELRLEIESRPNAPEHTPLEETRS